MAFDTIWGYLRPFSEIANLDFKEQKIPQKIRLLEMLRIIKYPKYGLFGNIYDSFNIWQIIIDYIDCLYIDYEVNPTI